MTYLTLSKIENQYYIMNSTPNYDHNIDSSNYGLLCKLEESLEQITIRAKGIYGRVANEALAISEIIQGCKAFKNEEASILIQKKFDEYFASFSICELATFDIQVREAEKYIDLNSSYDSSILKDIAAIKGIKVTELAEIIFENSKTHNLNLIRFKCQKDYIAVRLNELSFLDDFESFNIEDEIKNYSPQSQKLDKAEIPPSKEEKEAFEYSEEIGAILTKNNKKKKAKDSLNLLPLRPK